MKKERTGLLIHSARALRLRFIIVAACLITACAFALYQPRPLKPIQAASTTIQITEVEADPVLGGTDTANEWFEIKNVSASSVSMVGWTITDNFAADTIPSITLGPGESVVIVASLAGFNSEHPSFTGTRLVIADAAIGNGLANAGDILTLRDGSSTIIDCVVWGSGTGCFSPTVAATAGNSNVTLQRTSTTDTDTASDWTAAAETPTSVSPTASNTFIIGQVTKSDGTPLDGVTVKLSGSKTATTITDSNGRYRFEDLETGDFYSVSPSRANYRFSPSERSFSLLANKTDAGFMAESQPETANPLDTSEFFVRQQYVDFLNREPDQGGLNYWGAQLDQCSGDEGCLRARRAEVSAAFFTEREFQDSGYYLYRLYSASYARKPTFAEFMPDRASLVGGANLEQSKQAFADAWVGRAEFKQAYSEGMAANAFVNKLYDNAGVTGNFSEREAQISAMAQGKTRSQVLMDVIENASFKQQEYNSAFVLTEYFSYLRRDPDSAGFAFWLNVLNTREPNNYRGMVCSFLTSAEYQKRFSPVVSRSNSECGQ